MKTLAIIANGTPPETPGERAALARCEGCVCCDGLPPEGAPPLLQVVGDMDSLREPLPEGLATDCRDDQETNDLSKAVRWCRERFPEARLDYFGATGRREDHTLANLALIAAFGRPASVFTASGRLEVLPAGAHSLDVPRDWPISFLSFVPQRLTARGVVWPVESLLLNTLWRATLNRTCAETLSLECQAPLLVYQPWSAS